MFSVEGTWHENTERIDGAGVVLLRNYPFSKIESQSSPC